jgi:hypothetical protein
MTAKCDVCAIPEGETVCVTCGNGPQVEIGMVRTLYEVGSGGPPIPGFTMITGIREGVQVEPAPCGKCGRMTINRIESPDGQIGCLDCLGHFILGGDPLLGDLTSAQSDIDKY